MIDLRLKRIVAAPIRYCSHDQSNFARSCCRTDKGHLYGSPFPDPAMVCAILLRRWWRFDYDSQCVVELTAAGGGEHFFGNVISLAGINELARKFRGLVEVALE